MLQYVLMYLLLVRSCIKYCAISILKSRENILQYILLYCVQQGTVALMLSSRACSVCSVQQLEA